MNRTPKEAQLCFRSLTAERTRKQECLFNKLVRNYKSPPKPLCCACCCTKKPGGHAAAQFFQLGLSDECQLYLLFPDLASNSGTFRPWDSLVEDIPSNSGREGDQNLHGLQTSELPSPNLAHLWTFTLAYLSQYTSTPQLPSSQKILFLSRETN